MAEATNPFGARSVLITGCSSGIGLHAAETLRQRGYQVFATARKPEDVEKLRNEGFAALQLDLRNSDSIRDAMDAVLQQTQGRLYALFNNGAYGQPGAVEDLSRDALRQQLETNVLGWLELTRYVIPVMRAQGEGRIIQNSSVLGFVGLPLRGAYVCSKFALEGLSDVLRLELQGTGIHVILIQPGPIRSQFRQNAFAAFQQFIAADQGPWKETYRAAARRMQQPEREAPFTLGPEAVTAAVVKALESRRPRARYRVTGATHWLAFLRWILPVRQMDRVLQQISRGENRP